MCTHVKTCPYLFQNIYILKVEKTKERKGDGKVMIRKRRTKQRNK